MLDLLWSIHARDQRHADFLACRADHKRYEPCARLQPVGKSRTVVPPPVPGAGGPATIELVSPADVAKVVGVPLFSGFMYASVASFMCQAWRRFDLVMVRWPGPAVAVPIAAAIYGNFFTNLFLPDARWVILPLLLVAFGRTWVEYTPFRVRRRMPILVAFGLIAFFIWLAENIGTFLSAWRYPSQHHGWRPVYLQKLSSWYLLVIVSLLIVVELKRAKLRRAGLLVPGRIGHA